MDLITIFDKIYKIGIFTIIEFKFWSVWNFHDELFADSAELAGFFDDDGVDGVVAFWKCMASSMRLIRVKAVRSIMMVSSFCSTCQTALETIHPYDVYQCDATP